MNHQLPNLIVACAAGIVVLLFIVIGVTTTFRYFLYDEYHTGYKGPLVTIFFNHSIIIKTKGALMDLTVPVGTPISGHVEFDDANNFPTKAPDGDSEVYASSDEAVATITADPDDSTKFTVSVKAPGTCVLSATDASGLPIEAINLTVIPDVATHGVMKFDAPNPAPAK